MNEGGIDFFTDRVGRVDQGIRFSLESSRFGHSEVIWESVPVRRFESSIPIAKPNGYGVRGRRIAQDNILEAVIVDVENANRKKS